MKNMIIMFFIACAVYASARTNKRWLFSIQAQPEIDYYSNNFAFTFNPKNTKSTLNVGAAALIQYNLPAGFFIYTGLGYISRAFHTIVFLNQGALPPPQHSGTFELVTAPDVYYRSIFIPLGLEYAFINKKNFKAFANAEFCANYLLNAKYNVSEQKYSGTFPKNNWQGYSLSPGAGLEQTIKKNVFFACSMSYAVINHVGADGYLFSQSSSTLALAYRALRLSAGVMAAF